MITDFYCKTIVTNFVKFYKNGYKNDFFHNIVIWVKKKKNGFEWNES